MNEPRNILLAEDDLNDIELTLQAFAEHNLANNIQVVRDGAEALDYLYRRGSYATRPLGNPIVVLLDLKMPEVSGLEVLRQVKSDEKLKTIPIVAVTSSREPLDVERCYEAGINAYVVKPVRFPQFIRAAQELGIFWAIINQTPVTF